MITPRLIAVDMDGTLLHSDGHLTARTIAALRLAHDAGAEVVIATGRRHSFAMGTLREHKLPADHALISSNGAVIRTIDSHLIHHSHMPLDTALWLCKHVDQFRNTLVLTFDTVGPTGEDAHGAMVSEDLDALHTTIGRWMQANGPFIRHVPRLEEALAGDPPIQMMLCGTIDRMAEAEAILLRHPKVTGVGATAHPEAEITLHRTSYPERDLSIVDILPAGISKASALEHLAELRGLTMRDVLAIGDNWNDLPMLEAAGQAVLMANAPEELLDIGARRGWTIAPSNDEDGVAQMLEAAFAAVSSTR